LKAKKTLKQHRKEQKYTQADVAAKMKIPVSTYALMEKNGKFTEDELSKVAGILKISKDEIDLNSEPFEVMDIPYILNTVIKIEAAQRVILRGLADVYSEQTNTSATKILIDYTKAVRDEISIIKDELKGREQ
jgi:transcriptional regulator with XRE-family HTH domain